MDKKYKEVLKEYDEGVWRYCYKQRDIIYVYVHTYLCSIDNKKKEGEMIVLPFIYKGEEVVAKNDMWE
jgi:hypothetical protein